MSNVNVEQITTAVEKRLVSSGGTKAGADWAIKALDPFHDSPLADLRGFPDGTGMGSVIQVVTETASFVAPTGLSTPTWDCHFVMFPWITNFAGASGDALLPGPGGSSYTPNFIQGNNTAYNMAGLTAWALPAGAYPLLNPSTGAIGTGGSQVLIPDPQFTTGAYRVIGQAFEVRATGATLYKSGASVSWRQPTPSSTNAVTGLLVDGRAAGVAVIPTSMITMALFPQTQSDAMLFPDSVQMEAREGNYSVSRFNSLTPAITDNSSVMPLLISSFQNTAISTTGTPESIYTSFGGWVKTIAFTPNTTYGVTYPTVSSIYLSNFDVNGTIYTGLNPNDVLTVTVRWVIERFPSINEKSIMVMAKSPPSYDFEAIQAYSRAVCDLPCSVPVKMNGLGDWFKQAATTLTSYIAPVLRSIPHPIAQGLSTVAAGVNKALGGNSKQAGKSSSKMNTGASPGGKTKAQKKQLALQGGPRLKGKK